MKPGTFYVFAGLTAAAVVAAGIAVTSQTELTSLTAGTEPAFPQLESAVNDVARIELKTAKGEFSISLDGEKWGLDQKDGYPVEFEKVKSAVVGLANFKLIEKKTSDPDRYGRLDLQDPGGSDARSTGIVLRNAAGDVLAEAVVGKVNGNLFGSGGAGTYIRRGGDEAAWLARGQVALGDEPNMWMVRQIVNYGQEAVKRVTVRHPDGAEVRISKETKEDRNFVLADIPAGREIKSGDAANPLGGVMWRMMFDDVMLASKQEWPAETWVSHYTTWDGVTVRIEVAKIGDDHWGRFSAAVADDVTGADEKEVARQIADEIAARTDGWTYMLTAGDAEKLTAKIDFYLADPKKEGS
ncbi:MAG: DUF4340 domain-containing protein [Rhodospirillaceae bacterium]